MSTSHWLSLALSVLGCAVLARSLLRQPSLIVFTLIWGLWCLIARPLLTLTYGSTVLTAAYYTDELFAHAWLVSAAGFALFSVACTRAYPPQLRPPHTSNRAPSVDLAGNFLLVHALTVAFVAGMLVSGGTELLFTNRTTTIAGVNPLLRYVYPFAVVLSSFGAYIAVQRIIVRHRFGDFALLALYYAATLVIAQRGFLIVFGCIAATDVLRSGYRLSFRTLLIVSIVFVMALFAKDFLTVFAAQPVVEARDIDPVGAILARPDGDAVEVVMIAMSYAQEHGLSVGGSLLNNVFNFLPHTARAAIGHMNGQDVLNDYFIGDAYWVNGFGFNVTLPVEAYGNAEKGPPLRDLSR